MSQFAREDHEERTNLLFTTSLPLISCPTPHTYGVDITPSLCYLCMSSILKSLSFGKAFPLAPPPTYLQLRDPPDD